MDFLESLYSIENFGIYLFIIIGILVVLFLVVLFFGRKDQKKRKELEDKLEQTKISTRDAFKDVSEEPTNVEVPALEPEVENIKEENEMTFSPEKNITTNAVLNSDLELDNSLVHEEPSEEEPKKEFDFDALADAISKELAEMEKNTNTEPEVEPLKPIEPEINYRVEEPIHIEPEIPMPKEEVKPKPVMPAVFSSVYVNREKEEPKKEEVKPVTITKPEIELPKMMDLPKKASSNPEPVETIKPVLEEKDDDIIFP